MSAVFEGNKHLQNNGECPAIDIEREECERDGDSLKPTNSSQPKAPRETITTDESSNQLSV